MLMQSDANDGKEIWQRHVNEDADGFQEEL